VKSFPSNGTIAPYKTTFYGLYERSAAFDDKDPFSFRSAGWRGRTTSTSRLLTISSPRTTSSEAISGSPVINRTAKWLASCSTQTSKEISNRFIFSSDVGRTVSVHSRGIVEAFAEDVRWLAHRRRAYRSIASSFGISGL